jgi:hypothetical protein
MIVQLLEEIKLYLVKPKANKIFQTSIIQQSQENIFPIQVLKIDIGSINICS